MFIPKVYYVYIINFNHFISRASTLSPAVSHWTPPEYFIFGYGEATTPTADSDAVTTADPPPPTGSRDREARTTNRHHGGRP